MDRIFENWLVDISVSIDRYREYSSRWFMVCVTSSCWYYLRCSFYVDKKIHSRTRKTLYMKTTMTDVFSFFFWKADQLTVSLRWLPVFYGVTIMINVFSILLSAPPRLFASSVEMNVAFIFGFSLVF